MTPEAVAKLAPAAAAPPGIAPKRPDLGRSRFLPITGNSAPPNTDEPKDVAGSPENSGNKIPEGFRPTAPSPQPLRAADSLRDRQAELQPVSDDQHAGTPTPGISPLGDKFFCVSDVD